MKCGVVANMLVARAFAQNKSAWRGTLIFSSVTDEEAYSMGAHALVDGGIHADACLITEPFFEGGTIGAPGKVLVRANVTGKAAHGFLPWEGINAGIEAARFAAGVCDGVPPAKHERVPSSQTVLSINAGSAQYVVTLPEKAQVVITRLIVPGETRETVLDGMRGFAESLQSPAKFAFATDEPYYTPWSFDEPSHALTQAFVAAFAEEHGSAPELMHHVGITDANVICGEGGIPCIVHGPRGGNWHQCQEWVDLTSIPRVCNVLAGVAARFLQ
jgi:acetylornithine deacetylase/succinyl-diaminopimelate desuccinylase-like protein